MSQFHILTISDIQRLTAQSVVLSFEIPDFVKKDFLFQAGQYITLKATVNGTEVRRAYSLCSAPDANTIQVGVKAVEGGTFSVYANEQLKVGNTLEVNSPEGKFILNTEVQDKTYVAFAAGSGITPILSMIKTALQTTNNKFVLVYGNKQPEEAMFRDALLALREKYPHRLSIEWIYSQNREDGAHFGRISKPTVNFVVKNKYASHDFDSFYLCGPEAMIKEVTSVLAENGISESKILFELFTASDAETVAETLEGTSQVTIIVDDERHELPINQESIILDAVLEADIDPPYSCQGGICSSCIARVTEGTAVMQKNQILTDKEIAAGLILTCQAHPTSAKVVVDYDNV